MRLRIVVAALLALVCTLAQAQPLRNMPDDNAGGRRSHATYSAGIGAAGALLAPERPWWVLGACFAVGLAKEARDYWRGQAGYRHGLFSRHDLKANALGCAAGVGTLTLFRATF